MPDALSPAKLMAELGWTRCGSGGSRAAGIWSKCADTAANRSLMPDQQIASADCVDLVLPTRSSKVKN